MMKKDQDHMTFSAIWVGLFFSIGFVIKESRNEFGLLFALIFIILSIAEIIVERKLSNYKEIFPVLKAIITYFIFILVGYMFLGTSMKKPDDIVMLFIYALFPAMITYAVIRFIRNSNENAKGSKIIEDI